MKKSVLRFSAIAMATAGLAVGVAAASSASIDTTGHDSHNSVEDTVKNNLDVNNDNDLGVNNNNYQTAKSGSAKATENTTSGDVASGSAVNSNDSTTDVSVDNGGSCACLSGLFGGGGSNDGTISLTGAESHNSIEFKVDNRVNIRNDNDVNVNNQNNQTATSGKASADENTTVGNVTSGDASNTNTTSTTVHITN